MKGKKPPNTLVWYESSAKLLDKISSEFLREQKKTAKGGFKKVPVEALPGEAFITLILRKTHWGCKLQHLCDSETTSPTMRKWARSLRVKIIAFIRGQPHPQWSDQTLMRVWTKPRELRPVRNRIKRFIELLKTVNGIFLTRVNGRPSEVWDWHKYDILNLRNIDVYINDEFRDGELTEFGASQPTYYKLLRSCRKLMKSVLLKDHSRPEDVPRIPGHLAWLRILTQEVLRQRTDRIEFTYKLNAIRSTRGMGTPPQAQELYSRMSFLRLISTKPPPPTETEWCLFRSCVDLALSKVPDHAFTGLSTKAGFSVKLTAAWSHTIAEGGTIESVRELIADGHVGVPALVRNLDTGQVTGECFLKQDLGNYIFWRCLDVVLTSPASEISHVMMAVVREPGKPRVITKGEAALKIILDVISHICTWPLQKVPSCAAGLKLESQAWSFFQSFDGEKQFFVPVKTVTEDVSVAGMTMTQQLEPLFVSSTDFETATDAVHLQKADYIANRWMNLCGIPRVLRAVVTRTVMRPRWVYFPAKGPMVDIGTPSDLEGLNRILLQRGIMMGDPLTKVILTVMNMAIRHFPKLAANADWIGRYRRDGHIIPDVFAPYRF
jgi:hypothetical protein